MTNPTPKIYPVAGQIWIYTKNLTTYEIISVGQLKVEGIDWIPAVTYRSRQNGEYYTRDIKTFMEKFEDLT